MKSANNYISQFVIAVVLILGTLSSDFAAQKSAAKAPTSEDWTAVGKLPDFTGVWERVGVGSGGSAQGAQGQRSGRGVPRGPAYTPEYEAKRKAYLANPPEDNETANCLPPGMPGIMNQPYPMEFLLTPGKVTIVIEAYTQVRHIYTDGRPLSDDPDPKFHGTSVGHWEGDTLVVETVGFSPITQLERGVPHSDKMRIVERFRLTNPNTMVIETTITDPIVLASPYTTTTTLNRHRDWTLTEYICEENNRNSVDAEGKAKINLTLPQREDE